MKSILDIISDSISPVIRLLSDVNQDITGTQTQLLRIYQDTSKFKTKNNIQKRSVLGDWEEKLESTVIDNVIINYPYTGIELFTGSGTTPDSLYGMDIMDLLPIEASLKFNGNYEDDPIFIQQYDKIVDLVKDDRNNLLPVIFEVTRIKGNFFGKNMVSKKCDFTIYRGAVNQEMQDTIDKFIVDYKNCQ